MKPEKLLTIVEVSERLNVSVAHVTKLVNEGKISAVQGNGNEQLFDGDGVNALNLKIKAERLAQSLKGIEFAQKHGLYDDEFDVMSRKSPVEKRSDNK